MSEKEKIILIEDNPYNREITETALKQVGYKVISPKDGIEGIKKFAQNSLIVLLDLSLPKISGWDVVKKIREDNKYIHLPVIDLTAHAITRESGGTGLGLSISKKLLNLMCGKIEVNSKWQKKTSFRIIL